MLAARARQPGQQQPAQQQRSAQPKPAAQRGWQQQRPARQPRVVHAGVPGVARDRLGVRVAPAGPGAPVAAGGHKKKKRPLEFPDGIRPDRLRLCPQWERFGGCADEDCALAHSEVREAAWRDAARRMVRGLAGCARVCSTKRLASTSSFLDLCGPAARPTCDRPVPEGRMLQLGAHAHALEGPIHAGAHTCF